MVVIQMAIVRMSAILIVTANAMVIAKGLQRLAEGVSVIIIATVQLTSKQLVNGMVIATGIDPESEVIVIRLNPESEVSIGMMIVSSTGLEMAVIIEMTTVTGENQENAVIIAMAAVTSRDPEIEVATILLIMLAGIIVVMISLRGVAGMKITMIVGDAAATVQEIIHQNNAGSKRIVESSRL